FGTQCRDTESVVCRNPARRPNRVYGSQRAERSNRAAGDSHPDTAHRGEESPEDHGGYSPWQSSPQLQDGDRLATLTPCVIIFSIASSPSRAFRNMQNCTGRCCISFTTFSRASGPNVLRSMTTFTLSKSANPHFNADRSRHR